MIKKSERKLVFWSAIITIVIICVFEGIFYPPQIIKETKIENIIVDTVKKEIPFSLNQQSVYNMIELAQIKYPRIVLKQAICETGHFKSRVTKENNNLFGFHNGKEYLKFNTYFDCCIYYRNWQRKYYSGGDYYQFLENYGYASDSCYVDVLKRISIDV